MYFFKLPNSLLACLRGVSQDSGRRDAIPGVIRMTICQLMKPGNRLSFARCRTRQRFVVGQRQVAVRWPVLEYLAIQLHRFFRFVVCREPRGFLQLGALFSGQFRRLRGGSLRRRSFRRNPSVRIDCLRLLKIFLRVLCVSLLLLVTRQPYESPSTLFGSESST